MESETPLVEGAASTPAAPDYTTYRDAADQADLARASGRSDAGTTPAEPAEQAAATAAHDTPASDAGTPPEKGAKLKARRAEVDAEVEGLKEQVRLAKALREELATIRQPAPAKTQESQPAPVKAETWKRYAQHPDAPKVDAFESYEDYLDARAEFIADRRLEEREQSRQRDADSRGRVQQADQTIDAFNGRLKAATEADPGFYEKVDPGLFKVTPRFALRPDEPVLPANVALECLVTSDHAAALMQHFSTKDGQQEWLNLIAKPNEVALQRAFGQIEARFSAGSSASAVSAPAKPVTSAPAPPTTLGGRPPQSADRAAAALKSGDYLAFKAAQDAADLARRGK